VILAAVRRSFGRRCGPLYAMFLSRGTGVLEGDWPMLPPGAVLLGEGWQSISELGGAVEGDRTLLDALIPAAQALPGQTFLRKTTDFDEGIDSVSERRMPQFIGR
jgi:dihydroxyacetone kinase